MLKVHVVWFFLYVWVKHFDFERYLHVFFSRKWLLMTTNKLTRTRPLPSAVRRMTKKTAPRQMRMKTAFRPARQMCMKTASRPARQMRMKTASRPAQQMTTNTAFWAENTLTKENHHQIIVYKNSLPFSFL